jgi:hypothetical protein
MAATTTRHKPDPSDGTPIPIGRARGEHYPGEVTLAWQTWSINKIDSADYAGTRPFGRISL